MTTLGDALRAMRASDAGTVHYSIPNPPVAETARIEASRPVSEHVQDMARRAIERRVIEHAAIFDELSERQVVSGRITRWLSSNWDFEQAEGYVMSVQNVLTGDVQVWETWLELAPVHELLRAANLMEPSGE